MALSLLATTSLVITSCSGLASLPLPGGADTGDSPKSYELLFSDVLDLVPLSAVKINGVNVGKVKKISIGPDGWSSQVKIEVRDDVVLSQQAQVRLEQSSLLGEKYLTIVEPAGENPEQSRTEPVPLARTEAGADIEKVLGLMSVILNGGGVANIKPIVDELNRALGGRGAKVNQLLDETNKLVHGLEAQKDNITKALDGLDQLSTRAAAQTEQVTRILKELPEGMRVLEGQRPEFVTLLKQLDRLGESGMAVAGKAQQEIITDLRALRPILQSLGKAAPNVISALPLMLTYPFPDEMIDSFHGDSANLMLSLDLSLLNQLEALGVGQGAPQYQPMLAGQVQPRIDPRNPYFNGNGPRLGFPTITLLPQANSRSGPNTPPSGGKYRLRRPASKSQNFFDGVLYQAFGRDYSKDAATSSPEGSAQ